MSSILLSSSASETTSFSADTTSDSPVSTGSSTPSISGRVSPLPESDVGKAVLEGDCPLPIGSLVGADRAVLDLEGPSFCPLGAGTDGLEEVSSQSVGLDDIMLVFGTEEGGAEGAAGSLDWMLTEVLVKEKGEGLPVDAYRVDETGTSNIEEVAGGSHQAVLRCLEAKEGEESEAEVRGEGEVEKAGDAEEDDVAEEEGVAEERDWAEKRCWAEERGVAEERNWAEKKSQAEERVWAERRQLGELDAFREIERVAGGSSLGERVAEEVDVSLGACRLVGDFEKRKNLREVAEGSHLGEGVAEERQLKQRKKCLLVAERSQPHASAMDLVEFLGLGSSSDTEEDNLCVKGLGFEKPLAIVADERRLVEVEGSSGRLGECESEGLTEEVGVVRGRCSTLECWMTSGVKKCLF